MAGRPTAYSDELAESIIERICSGQSLSSICRDEQFPARSTVLLWVAHDREGFSDRYAKACHARAHYWADEIVDIADDGTNDYMLRLVAGEEREVVNPEAVSRSRLRVDTRKWLMSKLIPMFADKQEKPVGDDLVAALAKLAESLPT